MTTLRFITAKSGWEVYRVGKKGWFLVFGEGEQVNEFASLTLDEALEFVERGGLAHEQPRWPKQP